MEMIRSPKVELTLPAHFGYLSILGTSVQAVVEQLDEEMASDVIESVTGDLTLAIHEVCANIIDHAYDGKGDYTISVTIWYSEAREIMVCLRDNGRSYNPRVLEWPPPTSWRVKEEQKGTTYILDGVPLPDVEQNRGRGIFLIGQLVDIVYYRPGLEQNSWHLVKKL